MRKADISKTEMTNLKNAQIYNLSVKKAYFMKAKEISTHRLT